MSKNRNKHYNKPQVEETPVEEVVEPVVEETEKVEEVEAPEEVTEETITPPVEPVYGVVNCDKLNVRRGPSKDSKVMCIVSKGEEVMLVAEESTEEWYKVITKTGFDGYCMKEFIDM